MVVSMKQLTKPEPDKLVVDPPLSGASTGSGSVNAGSGTGSLEAAMGLPVVGSGVIHFIVGEGVMGTSAADVGALVEVSSNPPTVVVGADDDVLTSVETEGAADVVASSVELVVLGADVLAETGEAVGTLAGQHVSSNVFMVVHVSLDSSVFTASTNRSPHVFPTPIPTVSSTVICKFTKTEVPNYVQANLFLFYTLINTQIYFILAKQQLSTF